MLEQSGMSIIGHKDGEKQRSRSQTKRCRKQRRSSRMTSITQRQVNRKATTVHLVAPTSDLGRVTMIVLGDYWVVEVPRNIFGSNSLESRIKIF